MEGLDNNNNDHHHDPVFLLPPLGRNRDEEDEEDDDEAVDDEDEDEEVDDDDDNNNNNNNNANNVANNNDRDNNDNNNRNHNVPVNDQGDIVDLIENNGVLEGGVAEFYEPLNGHRNAHQADILLFLTCTEAIPFCPNHPILRPGVCVQIGLDKNVKLSALFHRYVNFCNESAKQAESSGTGTHRMIQINDLEFVHSTVLNGADTAENAALMKNDRISVRKERSAERQRDESFHKEHRETDKLYFEQLLSLVDTEPSRIESRTKSEEKQRLTPHDRMYADVLLKCEAMPPPSKGYVIPPDHRSTLLRCHSFVVFKRCPWLGDVIRDAKKSHTERMQLLIEEERNKQHARQSVVTVPEIQDTQDSCGIDKNDSQLSSHGEYVPFSRDENLEDRGDARNCLRRLTSQGSNEFDDEILELNKTNVGRESQEHQQLEKSSDYVGNMSAAQIDASDDDDDIDNFEVTIPLTQRHQSQVGNDSTKVWSDDCDDQGTVFVPAIRQSTDVDAPTKLTDTIASPLIVEIKDHPAAAMRLLLEYCYSNRVPSLGYEAFEQSCRTKRTSSVSRRNHGNANSSSPSASLPNWPVSPFSSKNQRWPNNGEPVVSFEVAIAGIKLAEEAGLYRLSFMCEVASSQILYGSVFRSSLVTPTSLQVAVKALELCEDFNEKCKNPLPRLRLAAAHTLIRCLRRRSGNAYVVESALTRDEVGARLVTPLLSGILDAIEESNATTVSSQHNKSSKRKIHGLSVGLFPSTIDNSRDWPLSDADAFFKRVDREEAAERENERRKRRLEAQKVQPGSEVLDVPSALSHVIYNYNKAKRLRGTLANRVFSTDDDISQEGSNGHGESYVQDGPNKLRQAIIRLDQNLEPHLLSHRHSIMEHHVASSALKRLSAHHHEIFLTHQSVTRLNAPPAAAVASSLSCPPEAVGSTEATATAAKKSSSSRFYCDSTTTSTTNNSQYNSSNNRGPR